MKASFSSAKRIAWLSLAILLLATAPSAQAVLPRGDYVEGEVLVRFRPAQTLASARRLIEKQNLTMARHFAWLSEHEGQVIALVRSPSLSTTALLAELRAKPAIALVEPNFLRQPASMRPPNDTRFKEQWNLSNTGQKFFDGAAGTRNADIGFLKAWGLAKPTTNEIVVGVMDGGFDPNHPDLEDNLWTNAGEIPDNGLDDDGNGYVDDVHGYDFVLKNGTTLDAAFHGTHVAGTIAASGNNGTGVVGVDHKTRLMNLRVAADWTSWPDSGIIEALQYATRMKARGVNIVALNMSLGGNPYSDITKAAIQAAGDAGIVLCAAAGNWSGNYDNEKIYPGSYGLPNIIVVAASGQNDQLAEFSNFGGKTVHLAAPGVNILSCAPPSMPAVSASVQQSTNVFAGVAPIFSGLTPAEGISGDLVSCGYGSAREFPAGVRNNIALIQRGNGLTYHTKVTNAMAAGARGVILYNDRPGTVNTVLDDRLLAYIPAIFLSQADGRTLRAKLPTSVTLTSYRDPAQLYQFLDGTSMAAPHVAAAVAFAARNFPDESMADRIQRVLKNTTPLSGLRGKVITGGRLNLARIVDTDNDGLPDWWELQHFGHLTGTDPRADADGEGASNLAEFLAGTDPTDPRSALRLTSLPPSNGNHAALTWPSAPGRSYRLLRATNLSTGFDIVLRTNLLATPPLNIFTDLEAASAREQFYRLELEP